MKRLEKLSMVAVMLLLSFTMAFAQQKPNIHILATGGTIAGTGTSATATNYTAGQVAIGTLLDAVPELKNIANVTGEQIVKIGSQDMNDDVWLTLAKKINQLLKRSDIDGIVITHGTDTMEETAYFLNLTVKSDKPVVLVGAMRPSTAISADGPLNLYNAVVVAGAKESKGKGVLVAMNGSVLGAASVLKMNTVDVQTFQAPNAGALGYVLNGKVTYNMSSVKKHTTHSVFDVTNLNSLPKVGIVYSYSNIEADMVTPMLSNGYKGIIHAGVGNGNIHKNINGSPQKRYSCSPFVKSADGSHFARCRSRRRTVSVCRITGTESPESTCPADACTDQNHRLETDSGIFQRILKTDRNDKETHIYTSGCGLYTNHVRPKHGEEREVP